MKNREVDVKLERGKWRKQKTRIKATGHKRLID